MNVQIICRNFTDDRVIPRFSRYLSEIGGWEITRAPKKGADFYYLSGYFEIGYLPKDHGGLVGAYLTHREEFPLGNAKAKLFDEVAKKIDLRVVTAEQYGSMIQGYGPTLLATPPIELNHFIIPSQVNKKIVAGFSGYTYANGRKGQDLAGSLVNSNKKVEWKASGRGWPVPTKKYSWESMPAFYQSLDVLIVTSLVEGIPMPPLEALACGVSVVIPKSVGMLDSLPLVHGIYRYERGNEKSLLAAFEEAKTDRSNVNREILREIVSPYTIEAWKTQHYLAVEELLDNMSTNSKAPRSSRDTGQNRSLSGQTYPPRPDKKRGIYIVAFGKPARECAKDLISTLKTHVPEIPICLVGAKTIQGADIFIEQEDSDVGGRRAKLKAYHLSPQEWESVLYLDADTEVISSDIRFYFELIEAGWEFVIAKDPHLMDTLHAFRRANNNIESDETENFIGTAHALQLNGGIWAFRREEVVERFFTRWQKEWERHAQRDQGALLRALYTEPLKLYILGNEWNTFPKYSKNVLAAAVYHYPGKARRWKGLIPGRIDSEAAWKMVETNGRS